MIEVRCGKCQGHFLMGERQLKDAEAGRAECPRCGASVDTASSAEPADSPALHVEQAEVSVEDYERMLTEICEPGFVSAPLPGGVAPPGPVLPSQSDWVKEAPGRMKRVPPAEKTGPPVEPAPAAAPQPERVAPPAPVAVAPAVAPPAPVAIAPVVAPPAASPKDPARTVRTTPSYTVSRSVLLDPETMVNNRFVAFFPESPELEPYRVLRTRILQAAEKKGGNTVMITSALPREGKTLTAVNLALTFSKAYLETALLVDCDLRQQRIHELLGFDSERGLGDYLTAGCPVSDMMVWPGVEKLTLISGGRKVPNSSELLGSPAMKELVEDMKGRYPNRYVFFDVPPVLSGADAMAFAPLVDHILFVVRAGATPMPEAQRALSMLPRDKVIGLVLNRQPAV